MSACERAVDVYPHVKKYIDKVEKKELKKPERNSFSCIKEWVNDPLGMAKMMFIIYAAKPLTKFLVCYQTDVPMLPFLYEDMHALLRSSMQQFIKTDVLEKASTVEKLLEINILSKNNLKPISSLELGFQTAAELKTVKPKNK